MEQQKQKPLIALTSLDADQRSLLRLFLQQQEYRVMGFSNHSRLLDFLSLGGDKPNAIVAVLNELNDDEESFLDKCSTQHKGIPIIAVTSPDEIKDKAAAHKLGAHYTLMSPIDANTLDLTVRKCLQRAPSTDKDLVSKIGKLSLPILEGSSAQIKELISELNKTAEHGSCILLQGETGTNRRELAQYIHNKSTRKSNGFIYVNCAAIPQEHIQSILFGKSNGRTGKLEQANGGSLMLDEIHHLPLSTQAMLSESLRNSEITNPETGGITPLDVHVICGTNHNLNELIEAGTFREDLLYIISVLTVQIPSIRKRKSDIGKIASSILEHICIEDDISHKFTLNHAAIEIMKDYPWPGNIRQMETILKRAVINSSGSEIMPENLHPLDPVSHLPTNGHGSHTDNTIKPLASVEEEYIQRALDLCGGSVALTARRLGVGRATLYRKLRQYEEGSDSFVLDDD